MELLDTKGNGSYDEQSAEKNREKGGRHKSWIIRLPQK